ncbi:MAG: hypothetical protein GEU80_17560 [Dehalococcoidia bacterium]|nr:hypothetical protein [Dehalococcoidia bacterium]
MADRKTAARTAPVIPFLRYQDMPAAIAFLKDAFGFEEQEVTRSPDGTVEHAELRFGGSVVMLSPMSGDGAAEPSGDPRYGVYIVVDDPDTLYARAKAAGAETWYGLTDQDYGSREFGARDIEGYFWAFGTYAAEATGSQRREA